MKWFLYLNGDSLYSCISQINDGLPTITTSVNKKADSKEEKLDDINALNANTSLFSTEKKLYDEAFDKLKMYLESKNILKNANQVIGDFLEINEEMFIVDLEYYKNIFSNDDILEFIKEDEVKNRIVVEKQNMQVSENGNKAIYDKGKLEKELRKQINLEYENIKKTINVILNIVPYNKFGIMGEYLIVLDDEYFRDKNKVVAYKYGGKMSMLGYLTNIVNNTSQEDENIFRTFPTIINTFMLNFFNKNEIKIIHPIAIYY